MSDVSATAISNVLASIYRSVDVSIINSIADLNNLILRQPDLVFTGMKYLPGDTPGQKIWLAGYLEQHRISHTGSAISAIKFEQDKPQSKRVIIDAGLSSSKYLVIKAGRRASKDALELSFPLFVKPTNLGAGAGIDANSIVWNVAELNAKTKALYVDRSADSLVEEYLPGREFSVGVLKQEFSENYMVMPIEMLPGPNTNGERIISGELKSAKLETPVSAVTEPLLRDKLSALALQSFIALGARDYGRIDIRLDAKGIPNFLEANLIPGLIKDSGNFQKACLINLNMPYKEMILHITRLGLARQSKLLAVHETQAFNRALSPVSV
ncbi:D-alanine--D-alanine ligase [Candidatus Saccharibacteria bacterium]|nr:D-alanine--D-alanine ligase [Candidatus Saccharibacteria bacterium]